MNESIGGGVKEYWVYFMFFDNYLKVGMAENVDRRVKQIKTSCPLQMTGYSSFGPFENSCACRFTEKLWHKYLKTYKIQGKIEWFILPSFINLGKMDSFLVNYKEGKLIFDSPLFEEDKNG